MKRVADHQASLPNQRGTTVGFEILTRRWCQYFQHASAGNSSACASQL